MKFIDIKMTSDILADDDISSVVTIDNMPQRMAESRIATFNKDIAYINDKYLNKSGIETNNSNSKCTDFILLGENYSFAVSATQKFGAPAGICIYDKDKKFLKAYGYATDSAQVSRSYRLSGDVLYGNSFLKDYPQAAYIRFSSYVNGLTVCVSADNPALKKNVEDTIVDMACLKDEESCELPTIAGYWVNGAWNENSYVAQKDIAACTDFIELKPFDSYQIDAHSYGTAAIYAIYNEGRQLLYAKVAGSSQHSYVYGLKISYDEIMQEYPAAKFIRFSSFDNAIPLSVKKLRYSSLDRLLSKQEEFVDVLDEIGEYSCYIQKNSGKNSSAYPEGIATRAIKIDADSRFLLSLAYMQESCGCAIYDSNLRFLGSILKNNDSNELRNVKDMLLTGEQIIQEFPNAAYIRFSSLNKSLFTPHVKMLKQLSYGDLAKRQQSIANMLSAANPLFGKTYLACGDSFTNMKFDDYIDEHGNKGTASDAYSKEYKAYKLYPTVIAENNCMKLINAASSGMPSYLTAYPGTKTSFYEFIPTLSNEISNADYMTFMFGLNDSGPIGVSTDTDPTTMWGAWNNILSTVLSCNPKIKLGIISPDGWLNESREQAFVEIGKAWGIPVLDFKSAFVPFQTGSRPYSMNQYAVERRNFAMQIDSENSHPNPFGQQYRSTIIENFMKTL